VFAGAVQDAMILFISTRRNARSIGEIIRLEMGPAAGAIGSVGILAIVIILLAVLGMVVVKALMGSPWGTFTIVATIPIAVFMGIYMRYLRPGRIAEVSVIGFALLMASIIYGEHIAAPPVFGPFFTLKGENAGAVADRLWLCRLGITSVAAAGARDYLSTFLKIGTILALAIGIFIVNPPLAMPSVTPFIDGTGPGSPARCSRSCYHHRLRRGLRLSCPGRLRHHTQDVRARVAYSHDRLRRDADGILCRDDGDDRRLRA